MSDWRDRIAFFKDRWLLQARPVYHKTRDWDGLREDGTVSTLSTYCGITVRSWDRESGEDITDRGCVLRRDYADAFARPCRKCWPEDAA